MIYSVAVWDMHVIQSQFVKAARCTHLDGLKLLAYQSVGFVITWPSKPLRLAKGSLGCTHLGLSLL